MTNQGYRIVYNTEKPVRQNAQNTTVGLFVEASLFWLPGWFHIHLFHLSLGYLCIILDEYP